MAGDVSPNHIVEKIGSSYGQPLALVQKFAVGEYGAFEVVDSDGKHLVLKQSPNPEWYQQIERARVTTNILRLKGCPVSEYVHVSHDAAGTYWLQKRVPGEPMPGNPTMDQLRQLVRWIHQQGGVELSKEQDWSRYVKGVLFEDESGWMAFLVSHSRAGALLVERIRRVTGGLEGLDLPVSDAVHGDFTCQQVLVKDGRIIGTVDWDAVGCGDRGLDLATLLFDLHTDSEMEKLLRDELLKTSGVEAARLYLAYRTLNIATWQVREKGNEKAIEECGERLEYVERVFVK